MNIQPRRTISGMMLAVCLALAGCAGNGSNGPGAAGASRQVPVPVLDTNRSIAYGYVVASDPQGNTVQTNIGAGIFDKMVPTPRPGDRFEVSITKVSPAFVSTMERNVPRNGIVGDSVFSEVVPYVAQPGNVPAGQSFFFLSGGSVVLATSGGTFAAKGKLGSGSEWVVEIKRLRS